MSLSDQSQQWHPTSVQVTVLQARSLRIKGKNGTNDAYAIMQVAKDKFATSVAEKSVAPVWKEEATFELPLFHNGNTEKCTLHVHVMHRALVGSDKLLGHAVINLLELSEVKSRNKTEWHKLLDKAGKPDKDRGEVLVDIQFMKNNLTASMFDLSATDKPRSRLGKFKDKVRGKKKEGLSDSASAVVPSFTQVLTDSEGEGEGEGGADKEEKKKKNKLKSLFSPKSNLQRHGLSQSMSVLGPLPEKDSSLSGSPSGLNEDSSEGKNKFKFLTHKRTGSSDSKASQGSLSLGRSKIHAPLAEQSNLCINGSHLYTEHPHPRSARTGSTFSLASSGHGSMEDLRRAQGRKSSSTSMDSLTALKQPSPCAEGESSRAEEDEEEEEERVKMDEMKRKEEQERKKLEEERMGKEEQEKRRIGKEVERLRFEEEEKTRKEEQENRKRMEEEKIRVEEESRMMEERKRRLKEEGEERVKKKEQEMIRLQEEEEERMRREEHERMKREDRLRKEDERKMREEEERLKREKEERIKEEEERIRREQEEEMQRREERLRKMREEEERLRMEEEMREEEVRVKREQDRLRKEEEESKIRKQEERIRILEEEMLRKDEEQRKIGEEEERIRRLEEEMLRKDEERKIGEEEERIRRLEEERLRKDEERKIREEEERIRRLEEERLRKDEERKIREEEERIRRFEEERLRKDEEERKIREEEERIRRLEEERLRKDEEERKIREEEERIRRLEEERLRKDEEERKIREEEERIRRLEEERLRKEEAETMRLEEERGNEQERSDKEQKERFRVEEENMKTGELRQEEKRRNAQMQEAQRREEARAPLEEVEKQMEQYSEAKVTVCNNPFEEVSPTSSFDDSSSNNLFEENPMTTTGPISCRINKVSAVKPRPHPVKPLSSLENQPASNIHEGQAGKSTGILGGLQEKIKVKDTEVKGPYSQLTQEELISLVLKQQEQLSKRDDKIKELEQYIDNLLVRIIEEQPSILMTMNSLK
uniref:Rab11 family-interacting protein 1-like n=1 Tax=Oncorhynchus tshawytscha TaxID=74940 RepID=A0AAZ3SJ31_ONCTS